VFRGAEFALSATEPSSSWMQRAPWKDGLSFPEHLLQHVLPILAQRLDTGVRSFVQRRQFPSA
jgi:hypothetical protein